MLSELVQRFDAMDDSKASYLNNLTQDQQIIHDKVLSEYSDRNIKVAVLNAPAGTGKTVLIRSIVNTCKERKISLQVCATTGKASSALKGKTIHSFLGLKMKENENAEKSEDALVLKSSMIPVSSKPKILIIDESSMIGESIMREIRKQKFEYVLFVLDTSQLPPVKDVKIEWNEIADSYHKLTKTLRAQDADLLKLFTDFREYRDGNLENLNLFDYVNNRNIISIDYNDMDFIPCNSDSCSVAYRNKNVEFLAEKLTAIGHYKYNLNGGINATIMRVKEDLETDNWGNYKRDFISEQLFFNGEDVKIIKKNNETTALIKNGYCYIDKYKIAFTKSNKALIVNKILGFNEKDSVEDKYFINLPESDVLEHCTLCLIEDKYINIIFDGSEAKYKELLNDSFMKLLPLLRENREIQKYIQGKYSDIKNIEIINMINRGELNPQSFLTTMFKGDYSKKWSDYLAIRNVVTARYTTARTINKAQGVSVPSVVITSNSFYGASLSAQYVAVTRAKYGIILVDNVPNLAQQKNEQEDDEILF